jgi:hypothetical protein
MSPSNEDTLRVHSSRELGIFHFQHVDDAGELG